jgi:hypothetical protein
VLSDSQRAYSLRSLPAKPGVDLSARRQPPPDGQNPIAGGDLAGDTALRVDARNRPRIISWISNAITITDTAVKISDPISVPEFMPGTSRREQ